MSNLQNHIIYNSLDYNQYKALCTVEIFLVPTAYGATEKLLYSKDFAPAEIRIYNNDEYYSLEFQANNKMHRDEITEIILNKDLRNKNGLVRTQITIYPNDKDKMFSLIISNILFLNMITLKDNSILDIYFTPNTLYMKSDSIQKIDPLKIRKYLDRNMLNREEKEFMTKFLEEQKNKKFIPEKQKSVFSFFKKNTDTKQDNNFVLSATEQKIFNMDALKIVTGSADPEQELNNLIGLENVKQEIIKLKAKLEYKKKREARGIKDESATNLHMCFLGSPGTGKTTVARIMTGLLYNMGYIKENKCIEIGANELKGGYTGQTSIKTKAILRNAKNKILFIDEAYSLFEKNGGYGKEALDVIIKEMEDNKDNLIIIFAGYQKEMESFLNMNDGLRSRINRYIYFDNYKPTEMGQIFTSFLSKKKLYIEENALEKSLILFKNAGLKDRFSNGRFARNLLEKVEEEHAFNVRNERDINRRDTITTEDISTDIVRELLTQSM